MPLLYWVGGAGNWSDTAHWSLSSGGTGGAGPPGSSDDVRFDNNSNLAFDTITFTGNGACRSFLAGGPYFKLDFQDLYYLDVAGGGGYGLTTFRVTVLNASSYTFRLGGTMDVYSYGYDMKSCYQSTGTITLQSALLCSSILLVTGGTLDTNNQAVSIGQFQSTAGSTITLGSSTLEITSNGTSWNFSSSATLNADTSTIKFIGTGSQTFIGGGKTYNNVWFNGSGGTYNIYGSNTYADFKADVACTLVLEASQLQTVSTFSVNGPSVASKIALRSASPGTASSLSKASGTVDCVNLDIQDSDAAGGATWNATNSINSGHNSGWLITAPHAPAGNRVIRLTYLRR